MKELNYIPVDKEKDLTISWFFDDIPQDYRDFRKFAETVDREYQELRRLLKETEEKAPTPDEAPEHQARVRYLQKRITGLEEKFPWLVSEQLLEYALWGTPH